MIIQNRMRNVRSYSETHFIGGQNIWRKIFHSTITEKTKAEIWDKEVETSCDWGRGRGMSEIYHFSKMKGWSK